MPPIPPKPRQNCDPSCQCSTNQAFSTPQLTQRASSGQYLSVAGRTCTKKMDSASYNHDKHQYVHLQLPKDNNIPVTYWSQILVYSQTACTHLQTTQAVKVSLAPPTLHWFLHP